MPDSEFLRFRNTWEMKGIMVSCSFYVLMFDIDQYSTRPASHFHCFSEIAQKSGAHQWITGPLHRPKFLVGQDNWAQAKWIPESQFKRFHGETIEVFSRTVKGKTVYLGKYKAIPLKNLQIHSFEGLPDYVSHLKLIIHCSKCSKC